MVALGLAAPNGYYRCWEIQVGLGGPCQRPSPGRGPPLADPGLAQGLAGPRLGQARVLRGPGVLGLSQVMPVRVAGPAHLTHLTRNYVKTQNREKLWSRSQIHYYREITGRLIKRPHNHSLQ